METTSKSPEWMLPDLAAILDTPSRCESDQDEINVQAQTIESTLCQFGIPASVVEVSQGPVATLFGVQIRSSETGGPSVPVKMNTVKGLADDLSLALSAFPVHIEAPLPNRNLVGIEVPNRQISPVTLSEVVNSTAFDTAQREAPLSIALGKGVSGDPVVTSLASLPNLLIAGTTGSGKSICLHAIITTLLCTNTPETLQMILVDPRRIELPRYDGIPHLTSPTVVDIERTSGTMQWIAREVEQRYRRFAGVGVRDVTDFNQQATAVGDERIPYVVVVIDDLAAVTAVGSDELVETLCRTAQTSQAAGIHFVVSTQRPSVDAVSGSIKASFPGRISLLAASGVDSRVALDVVGAQELVGSGNMVFMQPGVSHLTKLRGCLVSDAEIERVVAHWQHQAAQRKERAATERETPTSAQQADTGVESSRLDRERTLLRAREAIRRRHTRKGRKLLGQVIAADPSSEIAWLWLSAIVDDPEEEQTCLERVLEINPGNEIAQRHLAGLEHQGTDGSSG